MNERTIQINNHQMIIELEGALELIHKIIEEEQSFDEQHIDIINRCHHVLTQLITIYKNTDPLMVNPTKLTTFVNNTNNSPRFLHLQTNLKNYIDNRDIGYLNNVNRILDITISFFSYFLYPKTGREVAGLRNALEKYHSKILDYMSELQEKVEIFEQTAHEVGATVDEGIESNNIKISEFETNLVEKQEELYNDFSIKISLLGNEYEEKYDKVESTTDALIKEIKSDLENLKEGYQTTIDTHIKEVQGIIGALAERSISYGFQKIADEEKKSKQNWNLITLIAFIVLIAYTVGMVVASFYIEFTWSTLMLRTLGGIGAFGALIGYSSRQASIHANVERNSRRMELELASLNPYFAGYEKNDLLEVKMKLADRYFGKDDFLTNSNKLKDTETRFSDAKNN